MNRKEQQEAERTRQRLRNAAFMLAQDENKSKPDIKKILKKKENMVTRVQQHVASLRKLKEEARQIEADLEAALRPFVRKDLQER